ncbi:MAG: hypothetical protein JXB14_02285 [Candidatus Altiarchaeota archaeon]|nr:hypothetical protein [Candidatus Altiarchaeota archaeon]
MSKEASEKIHRLDWLRKLFLELDRLAKPIMGIEAWDDAVCVEFGGKRLVVSCDGPYKKRLVMKSALIHASTDVVVKGARPLFALDTLTGSEKDILEMAKSLKGQAMEMGIPILGGNTMIEDVEARANIFVVGELITEKPIRDSGGEKGDRLLIVGEPLWGSQAERFAKAKRLFGVWFRILGSDVGIHASKDVTKGGLIATVTEIAEKSGLGYELEGGIPYHLSRNLDNFLISADGKNAKKILDICATDGLDARVIGGLR